MSRGIIKKLKARKVIDTRAEDTIEVEVLTVEGATGRSAAPKGAPASKGVWEAPAYPPGGVDETIKLVNEAIAPRLKGMNALDQELVDETLHEIDGTTNFSKLGGNAATAISIAVAKAASTELDIPLYRYLGGVFADQMSVPIANVIGGGPHARIALAPDFQEHQVVPMNAKSIREAIDAVVLSYKKAREFCINRDATWTGGKDDEGAWVPNLTDWEVLEILEKVGEEVKDEMGVEMRLGLDCAVGTLWDEKREVYVYPREAVERDTNKQMEHICELIERFNLYHIEDFVHDDDFDSFKELTKKYGNRALIDGDDLFACDLNRLKKGVEMAAANSLIIKVNMSGTLTDTWKVVKFAHLNGYVPIKSCRSGETEDATIAHLAVALNCPLNKFAVGEKGATKLNELIRISEELGSQAKMPHLATN